MVKKYKKSMFIIKRQIGDGKAILYNSLRGKESIRIVSKDSIVYKVISGKEDLNICSDYEIQWLISAGYLVRKEVDERAIRDAKKAHILENNYLNLTIHITKECNFRCVYCSNEFTEEVIMEEVQKNIIKFLKRNIYRYSGVCVSWFGGEPLLETEIINYLSAQIIEICKKAKKPYFADITTNGYMLEESVIEKLQRWKVREICVTIDGDEKTHNRTRKTRYNQGTYKKIIENLLLIKEKYKHIPLNIFIRINLTKDTIKNFSEYYEEFNRLFGSDSRFSLYLKLVRDWGGKEINVIRNQLVHETALKEVYKQYVHNKRELSILEDFEQLEFGGLSCNSMKKNSLVFFHNGDVSKCEKNEKFNVLGKLTQEGIEFDNEIFEMWNGIAYKMKEKCQNCPISTLCFGNGCPRDKIRGKNAECEMQFATVYNLLELYATLFLEKYPLKLNE